MERIPSSWYQAVLIRKSRRTFHPRRPEEDKIVRLEKLCAAFRPFPGARAELVRNRPDEVFRGSSATTAASRALPIIWPSSAQRTRLNVEAAVGYTGEALVLEATVLGLGTCWVSGFFRPDAVRAHVDLGPGERVFAVTPVGYAERRYTIKDKIYRRLAGSAKRKTRAKSSRDARRTLAGEGRRSRLASPLGGEPASRGVSPPGPVRSPCGRMEPKTSAAIRSASTAGSRCCTSRSAPGGRRRGPLDISSGPGCGEIRDRDIKRIFRFDFESIPAIISLLFTSGSSAAWLAHSVRDAGVVGSNPTSPTIGSIISGEIREDGIHR